MQRTFIAIFGVAIAVLVTACNANQDAVHVVETQNISLQATIASYGNMGATVTAQATLMAEKLATAQVELTAVNSQVRDLTGKLNAGVSQSQVVAPPSQSTDGQDSTPAANTTPGVDAQNGDALSFATVVTAKGKDNDGCAVGSTDTFNTTDASIWVVADVRNYKRGTVFTAKWTGDSFNRSDNWTVTGDGTQICVHFYIQPKTLALAAGSYTVTMSAGDVSAQPVTFTLQAPSGGNTIPPTAPGPTDAPS